MSERSIVHVTLWSSPYLGNFMSSEIALARAARAELGLGSHFVLAPGAEGQSWLADLDREGITWSILPARRRRWRAHVDRVIDERSAALVHTHFTAADVVAAGASAAAGVPCVWHIRTGFNGYPLRRRLTDVVKMRIVARRRVARIITVSPWLAEFAARRGAPREKIVTIPNAIVLERFADPPARAAARERFGLDADVDVVLGLGWWPDVKGVDVLVDAVAKLAERGAAPSLLLVGEEQMRAFLAGRFQTPPPWLHTSGFVSDPAWLYAAADIFVSASRHEGQSSAIGEALACALPVVMSDIPGTAGWGAAPRIATFPSADASALAERLAELLAMTPQERAAKGGENREWVRGRGVEAWCRRICEIYRELL